MIFIQEGSNLFLPIDDNSPMCTFCSLFLPCFILIVLFYVAHVSTFHHIRLLFCYSLPVDILLVGNTCYVYVSQLEWILHFVLTGMILGTWPFLLLTDYTNLKQSKHGLCSSFCSLIFPSDCSLSVTTLPPSLCILMCETC